MNTNETQNNDNQTEQNIQLTDLEPNNEVKGSGVTGAGVLTLNGNTLVSQSSTGIRRLDGLGSHL